MNIVLININIRPYMDKAYFPIGLAFVATAMKRAGYAFDLIDIEAHRHTDEEVERLLLKKTYDVIAFGTLVSGYKFAKNIAAIARKTNPAAVIIAGNSVGSSIPEHLLRNTEVNIAVKGEGDITITKLLQALEQKKPLENVPGIIFLKDDRVVDTGYEVLMNIDEIGFPEWELFDMDLYVCKAIHDVRKPYPLPIEQIKAFAVNTARGCPFRCSFCYHVFQYAKYRYRSPESIIAEIALLQERYGINYINFFDELTFFSIKQVEAFIDKLLSSNIRFFWNADIRANLFTEADLPLLRKIKEAGCLSLGYSLESGNPDILKSMNKNLTVENFTAQKRALDKAGITTITSLVMGYPQETLETLKQTFDICYDLDIYPSVGYLLPQPGTPMMEAARKKGYADNFEDYLFKLGDRQDLRFNLTNIPDDVLTNAVTTHLQRIAEKMGLGFKREDLIKTHTHITSKKTM
jgi:anaerobic magnesium-protoporphyrin IX monomethyl ester cyclase